jgi:hypothetical protein
MNDRPPLSGIPEQVAFDYIKSSHFRVIHCDGVIGGMSPAGYIHATLFSERGAIPQRHIHRLNPDGQLGELVAEKTQTRESIVREMDVDVVLSVSAAEVLIDWLIKRVAEAKSSQSMFRSRTGVDVA